MRANSSLHEAMALKCLARGRMTIIELVTDLDSKVENELSMSAKYASIRRLKEALLVQEVKSPSTRGKVLELTAAGKDELEQIENFWRQT
jgi:DNA-binding PadR family transcriptional regulator